MKEFSSFRLDEVNQCLWKRIPEGADERIPLAPKTFALLQYLVEKAGRLITRQELLDNVWAGAYVQPEVLKTQILAIRGILGDNSKNPTFIETRARRGYRFIAPVSSASQPAATPLAAPSSHLVGREKAFEALQTCLQSALKHEQRQVVFVTGEPGLGKTTLVDEFLRQIVVSELLFFT